MPQIKNNNYHSEEAMEVLGRIPSWTIRWGITVIFIIFIGIILACYLIKYPERVNGIVTITTNNSPIDVVAKSGGNIELIPVVSGDTVHVGDILGVITTGANYIDVLTADSCLAEVAVQPLSEAVFNSNLYIKYSMGDLQGDWTSFISVCKKYRDYILRSIIKKKKLLVIEQIDKQTEFYRQMQLQYTSMERDLGYEKKNYYRDSSLFAAKVIPEIEYDESARRVLQVNNSMMSFKNQITSTELSIIQLKQQLVELTIQEEEDIIAYEQEILVCMDKMSARMQNWKLLYLLTSPIEGTVSFVQKWDKGQFIHVGESYLTIVPKVTQSTIGLVRIPQNSIGKVHTGQKVNVKLEGFPYMEYGMLSGIVAYLSSVPEELTNMQSTPFYTAIVEFPNGMKTTYGKKLNLIQKMEGSAEIITGDKRLAMRFLNPIMTLFRNGI